MNEGRIIAVVGTIASGKSTLVRQFADRYGAEAFYEGESADFPERIKENLRLKTNGLQTELYFFSQTVIQYAQAERLRMEGKTAVLDTYWKTNDFYLDAVVPDPFDRELFRRFMASVAERFRAPDVTIFLDPPDTVIAERIKRRGRAFEMDALPTAREVARAHRHHYAQEASRGAAPLLIVRDGSCDLEALAAALHLEPALPAAAA